MKTMELRQVGQELVVAERDLPIVGPTQILVRVTACAVCRTDLHVVDGELPNVKTPIIPGHEIVGRVIKCGGAVTRFRPGDRVGIPWLASTCGNCDYCRTGRENLCDEPQFTGYTRNGGFAEFTTAEQDFAFALPDQYSDVAAAPLMCAGLIGYRSLRMAGDASRLGIYGFGAAAHIVAQVANWQGREVYAFTTPGDQQAQKFAMQHGAVWAGDSTAMPPKLLDAAIIFAPVGSLVPQSLKALVKGGTVVCGGIHMSDIPSFPYHLLWHERVVRSIANLTRRDGEEFLKLAPQVPVRVSTEEFPLAAANDALRRLRHGDLSGAAVLVL